LCTYDLYGPVRNVFVAGISITRAVGGGWALELESFLGPVKWHRADRRVPFGAQKTRCCWLFERIGRTVFVQASVMTTFGFKK